jgi:hypothetical protein
MNAFLRGLLALIVTQLVSAADANDFSWSFQRTGFRSTAPSMPQTAVSMRSNLSWPVVYGVDAGALHAYSLFPVLNPGPVPIGPATNWHDIGTILPEGGFPTSSVYLQAASGAPDSFGVAVQTSSSLTLPPSATVWGTSLSGFHAPQSNTQAIKFDEDGDPFIASTSMIPLPPGRPETLHDVALAPTGEIGAIVQQSNGLGPLSFWQRTPLLGGAWLSTQITPLTGEQSLFGPSADLVYDARSRPYVIGLDRLSTNNSIIAYHFNPMSGAWQRNTIETSLDSPPISDVAAAVNDKGVLGAAWVNDGVLKYAYLDTNETSPNWVTTIVASTTPTGMPLELSQGVGLAYDKSGLPVISFVERSNRQIWIAYDPPLIAHATGDFNGDGLVDAGDLNVWTLGMVDGNSAGDADADGDADGADFLAWQRQLGATSQSSATTAVPETTTVGLAIGALAMIHACGVRRSVHKAAPGGRGLRIRR